ncbi:MAG TPA: GntR family transcriptional regulator [Rubrivivax sp.]|jgi:GntR family transcriptional regulator|nr:GntR family transcriptional regulator [Rubrivivax sp.]
MKRLADLIGPLDPRSPQPLYLQLHRALRAAIDTQTLRPDDALPSERLLAADLGISRITVRKAIDALVAEGRLVSRQGAGNFVTSPGRIDKNFAKLTSFSEDMRSRGHEPRSEWLKRSAGVVSPDEAMKLGVSPGTPIFRFHRLRFADDRPMAIEYATVLGSALRSMDTVGDSLYAALDAVGNRPVRALQRLRALLLDDEQARLLQTEPDAAGLLVERIGYDAAGRAMEVSQSIYRGDTYDFVAELSADF